MDFQQVAGQIGGGIAGIINPVIGGNTTTTVTSKPSASSGLMTGLIIAVSVIAIGVVAYLVLKK